MENRKMAAALVAVNAYIEAEEQAAVARPRTPRSPAWAMAGRVAQAQLNGLVQIKVQR